MILAIFDQKDFSYFDLQVPRYFLLSFESTGLSVHEKKFKTDFQDGHLGFQIGTILAFLICKSPWYFLPSFESVGHGCHLGFPIRMILAIFDQKDFSYFDLQVPRYFLLSFESIGLSVHKKKFKIDFQDGGYGGHLGFPIRMILAIFLSASHPDISYQVSSLLAFRFRSRTKQIFKMATMDGHLGFPIGRILAIFDLHTLILPTRARENRKNSRSGPKLGILDRFQTPQNANKSVQHFPNQPIFTNQWCLKNYKRSSLSKLTTSAHLLNAILW